MENNNLVSRLYRNQPQGYMHGILVKILKPESAILTRRAILTERCIRGNRLYLWRHKENTEGRQRPMLQNTEENVTVDLRGIMKQELCPHHFGVSKTRTGPHLPESRCATAQD